VGLKRSDVWETILIALNSLRLVSSRGYWRNESATEGSFTADKWLKTGDVVKVDEEGFW
jgi:acyl-CoA synthetase (AMP-forming)/AMP-acid ligase II